MKNDLPFQITIAFEACFLAIVWIRAALASGIQRGFIYNVREGWLLALSVRLLVLASGVGLLLYLLDPAWMAWAGYPLPASFRWCGCGFGATGLIFFLRRKKRWAGISACLCIFEKIIN